MAPNKPLVIVNFKAYAESTGENAVRLAKQLDEASKGTSATVVFAVSAADLSAVAAATKMPLFTQHCDAVDLGAHTGSIPVEVALARGATGTLINHSEKRLTHQAIGFLIQRCRLLNLTSVVCAATAEEAAKFASLNPDFVAIEPPELIGSGISVSKARPEIVTSTIDKIHRVSPKVRVLCGAGISGTEDVAKAMALGADGILLASYITKAKDPAQAINSILRGIL